MKRYTGTAWLRGAVILSVILIGTSMGGSLQTASAAGNPFDKLQSQINALQAQVDALSTTGGVVQSLEVPYDLAPGAFSDPITPVSDRPVLVMGVQTNVGNRGVGQVTILHPSVAPFFIEWVGLESTAGSVITQGFSGVAGTHILFLDFAHTVDIEVASPDTIRIHNTNAVAQKGSVKLVW